MTGSLDGRVAVVTGAGSGIGRTTAELFADRGAAVAALDVNATLASETASRIRTAGGRAIAVEADVSVASEVEDGIARVVAEFGRLDVLFNNAGVERLGSFVDSPEADWDYCYAVNVKGTFLCTRAAVAQMDDRGGAIVNQSSVCGLIGVPNYAAYSAAKGAVIALTRVAALDLAPRGIRVNVICPGAILTPLLESVLQARGEGDRDAGLAATRAKYPIGRLGTPEDIARVALFLASEDASFITGSIITADGGVTAQ